MKRVQLPEAETAVFSWRVESSRDAAFLADLGVEAVFQEVPRGQEEVALEFLSAYDVYLLTGSPDMDAQEMIAEIDRSAEGFKGVVFDIEPYGQARWATTGNQSQILDDFCASVECAYQHARERGVKMLLCIPFWYDELGFDIQLERIVSNSDGICVMNYSRGNERTNVAGELVLAERYEKSLWTIYELTPSDGDSVRENNTYYAQGLAAVAEDYATHFSDTDVGLAYHDIDYLRVLLQRGD